MGSLSYLQPIIDQNVIMHHINVEEMQAIVLKDIRWKILNKIAIQIQQYINLHNHTHTHTHTHTQLNLQ